MDSPSPHNTFISIISVKLSYAIFGIVGRKNGINGLHTKTSFSGFTPPAAEMRETDLQKHEEDKALQS